VFSISQLQQYSGIKAHTIRIWEQRYNALRPNRSEGNTRYYDHNQLRRLLNIVSLMESGHKVSELCHMPDNELFEMVDEKLQSSTQDKSESEYFVSQLIASAVQYDEAHFEKVFASCMQEMNLKQVYVNVIYPLLSRIGMMWVSDTMPPAQEHFMSNLLRKKLFSAIDTLPTPTSKAESWLLFLPENEFHEIGLLFAYFLLKQSGKHVIYLGSNVGFDTLLDTKKDIQPTHLLLFMVHHDDLDSSQVYLESMARHFVHAQLHVSGNQRLLGELGLPKNMQWIQSVEELEQAISN
jgi:MerR family transcriptional regulator, light-induced transcriptional regulator